MCIFATNATFGRLTESFNSKWKTFGLIINIRNESSTTFKYCLLPQLVSGFPSSGINKDGVKLVKIDQAQCVPYQKENNKLTELGLGLGLKNQIKILQFGIYPYLAFFVQRTQGHILSFITLDLYCCITLFQFRCSLPRWKVLSSGI